MLLACTVVVDGATCVQRFETSSSRRTIKLGCVTDVRVGVRVLAYFGITSFGSWNMEMIIVFTSKTVHISSIIFATKSPYFYKVCKLRF